MRALAEAPQLLMHYADIKYNYIMSWDYYDKEWQEVKPQIPFKQLPMIVVDDEHEICQSIAILNFIENIAGLKLKDPVKEAQANAILQSAQELFLPLNPAINFAVGEDFAKRRDDMLPFLLTRFGELGCFIDKGCITFDPSLLLKEEFLTQKKTFTYFDVSTTRRDLDVNENQLAFTFCQIPIIYSLFENDNYINILFSDNTNAEIHGNLIDADKSSSIFNRDGIVKQVEFYVNEKFLFNNIN